MNLMDGIKTELARCENELLPAYKSIGASGVFGASVLQATIKEGKEAMTSDDAVRMVVAYRRLKECE